MTQYLTENCLIEVTQHGSRSRRGTITQLIKQHDIFLENMAKGSNIYVTYLDLSKTFDLVDYSLLLRKLKEKGFRENLLRWLRNFPCDRKQLARVGQSLSRESPLHSGVPQGSVLGPSEGHQKAIRKVLQKTGWLKHIFHNRSLPF